MHYTDSATGNFALLSSLLFYSGQQNLGTGAANQPHTSGNVGFELRPFRRLRIIESWMTDRYHDAASPLAAEQILLTPKTLGPDLVTAPNYTQVVNYNQQQTDVLFDLTSKLTLRGGYRYVWGDATVLAGQFSQSGPLASGQLSRNVGLAGLTFRPSQKLSVNLDYEGASSDRIYFRTSLNDYYKLRARARYQLAASLMLQANFQVLNNQNPAAAIQYNFRSRDNSLAVYWTPAGGKRITVMGEYDRSSLSSSIDYLGAVPEPGGLVLPRERAHGHLGHRYRAARLRRPDAQVHRRRIAVHLLRHPALALLPAAHAAFASAPEARILEHRVEVLRLRGAVLPV